MDLTTTYLGLTLPHPLIAGASPLADDLDVVRRLEDAGAAAIVMYSLFEEQIKAAQERAVRDIDLPAGNYREALTYFARTDDMRLGPEVYLEKLTKIKEQVAIPVFGSLNGVTEGGWVEYARKMEEAGADGLELNLYLLATDLQESSEQVEQRLLTVVRGVREHIAIPVAVKLSPFFSALPHFVKQLEDAGANGVLLFNRFYQPDIDIDDLEVVRTLTLSEPEELLLRLRWLAILSGRVNLSLGATGGVHGPADAIKAIMAGAHGVQMVSALLHNGPEFLETVVTGIEQWMEQHEYESIGQLRGSMSLAHTDDPAAFERANYIRILQGGPG